MPTEFEQLAGTVLLFSAAIGLGITGLGKFIPNTRMVVAGLIWFGVTFAILLIWVYNDLAGQ